MEEASQSDSIEAKPLLEAEIAQYETDVANLRRLIAHEKILLEAETLNHDDDSVPETGSSSSSGEARVSALRTSLQTLDASLSDDVTAAASQLDEAGERIATSSKSLSQLSADMSSGAEDDAGGPAWVDCSGIGMPVLNALADGDVIEWDGGISCRRHPDLHLDPDA